MRRAFANNIKYVGGGKVQDMNSTSEKSPNNSSFKWANNRHFSEEDEWQAGTQVVLNITNQQGILLQQSANSLKACE